MRQVVPKNAKLIPEDAECMFRGVIYDVYHWQQELYDGTMATYEMLRRPDTVSVIAIKDGKIVVLDQEQPSYKRFYDLPGGRHDDEAEDEIQAAKRELLEETGMTFKTWRLIDVQQPHGKIEWFIYTFLATDFVSQTEQKLDAGEKIEIDMMTLEQIIELKKKPEARYLAESVLGQVQSMDELMAYRTVS